MVSHCLWTSLASIYLLVYFSFHDSQPIYVAQFKWNLNMGLKTNLHTNHQNYLVEIPQATKFTINLWFDYHAQKALQTWDVCRNFLKCHQKQFSQLYLLVFKEFAMQSTNESPSHIHNLSSHSIWAIHKYREFL